MALTPVGRTRSGSWRCPGAVGVGLTAALLLLGAIGYLTTDRHVAPAPIPDPIQIIQVPGGTAAVSQRHGPFIVVDGRASGFAHDELGAALAASNLAPRVSSAAGPQVYEPTIAAQSWGDPDGMLARLRSELPPSDTTHATAVSPHQLYYRVIAGDPRGEHVVISLLADTGQARALGGLSRVDVSLRWVGEDWQLRVPTPRPSIHPNTTGYTPLRATS